MDLCKKTFLQTKDLHKKVDTHIVVKGISLDSKESIFYINTIEYILQLLEAEEDESTDFFESIKRHPKIDFVPKGTDNLTKKIMEDYDNPILFASQIYLWYLSLMAGGKILRKKLPEKYHYLFDYTESQKNELKQFINSSIPIESHDIFIENVGIMYKLIASHFDTLI